MGNVFVKMIIWKIRLLKSVSVAQISIGFKILITLKYVYVSKNSLFLSVNRLVKLVNTLVRNVKTLKAFVPAVTQLTLS